jgi:hypothetical protein
MPDTHYKKEITTHKQTELWIGSSDVTQKYSPSGEGAHPDCSGEKRYKIPFSGIY